VVGGKAPGPAAPAPAPQPPDRHRPEAGLIRTRVILRAPAQGLPADRTAGRRLVRLLLRRFFQQAALQPPRLAQDFLLQMAKGLVAGLHAARQAHR
jgi:hypothetical protein